MLIVIPIKSPKFSLPDIFVSTTTLSFCIQLYVMVILGLDVFSEQENFLPLNKRRFFLSAYR